MTRATGWGAAAAAVAVAAAAGVAGYWFGQRGQDHEAPPAAIAQPARPAQPATIAQPAPPAPPDKGAGGEQRRVLYYRNPMGLPDTSPVPKKDPMGMDYIPVYEGGEAPAAPADGLTISTEKIQKLGVRTEAVVARRLEQLVRAVGRVEVDERRVYAVAPKFEGWVERLHVNATGQPVAKGQALFEAYSPELVSAQHEYLIALQGAQALKDAAPQAQAGMRQLAESALQRLKNWDVSDEQIAALASTGQAKRTVTFRSPASGIVMEKGAVQGMRFMAGESLYRIADLSSVWVLADVFEQDIGLLALGARVKVKINAYPDKTFAGAVTYIYPTLKAETRTATIRLELGNAGGLLKPAMFAQVEIPVAGKGVAMVIPTSAVIDSGTRQIALVQLDGGRFEPRELRLGARSETHVEVLSGLSEGERVVVAANFLIDAESNLRAAVRGADPVASPAANPAAAMPDAPPSPVRAPPPKPRAPAQVGHEVIGVLDAIDEKAGEVSVAHGPVASLRWPAMTMDFALANPALVAGLKPGTRVAMEIVERKPGEWVVTRMRALQGPAAGPAAAGAAAPPGR